jgi:SAM-dependent methyltransferase
MEMADGSEARSEAPLRCHTYRGHAHREKDVVVSDPIFAHPRLAAIYDFVDDDRSDLDVYVELVHEFGATSVLDIGCGTGTFACQLARLGKDAVGLDPASASLAVARRKPFAERVRWVHGDVSRLPALTVDLVTMTGNVAQVFLTDAGWTAVLTAARAAMRSDGRLVFETRDRARRGWERWTKEESSRRVEVPEVGLLESWVDVTAVELPYVTFRHTFLFWADGTELTSHSTLRFRSRDEIAESLDAAGFQVCEVRDAPDRPELEMVFIARPVQQHHI